MKGKKILIIHESLIGLPLILSVHHNKLYINGNQLLDTEVKKSEILFNKKYYYTLANINGLNRSIIEILINF